MEKGQQQETFLNCLLALVAAGIFVASIYSISPKAIISITLVSFAAATVLLKYESKVTFIPFCILFFMLGVVRYQAVDNLPANDISSFAGSDMSVTGTIREQPRIRLNADDSYSVRYTVDVKSVTKSQEEIVATGGLNINVRYESQNAIPTALIGYKISAYGTVRKPINYNNPGQLDIVTMLKSNEITASLSVGKAGVEIEYVEGSLWTKFLRTMAAIREHYKDSMRQVMSNEDAAAIFAMLFGGYEGLKPELTESFVTTGIVHILSVSGSHMSLLAATTAWICNFFGWRRWIKISIGLIVILTYTILSGFIFPVIRSAFMGFLVFFATSSNKYYSSSRRSLTIIAMFILLYSPLALFHISFQLSFLSTVGLLYLSPKIIEFLTKGANLQLKLYEKVFNPRLKLSYFLSTSLACTISALIFSQPIVAWYFNQLSISSLLANLIVIPILEIIIIFGLFAGIVGLIVPLFAKVVFLMDSLMFGTAYELNKLIAALPMSNVYFPTINFAWSAIYYVVLLFVIQKRKVKEAILNLCKTNVKIVQGICAVIVILIAFNIGVKFVKPLEMQVHFIDVHQGDSALVITPHDHAMMFDTGGVREHAYDIGGRIDVPYLHHYGITKLDYIFLTHAHEDHAAGAGSIVKSLEVDNIITANEPKSEYAASMAVSEELLKLNNLRSAVEGEIYSVDGVKVEVLFAPKAAALSTGNEVSNVYKVTFGNISFLFTGDLIKENEAVILREHKDVKSTVLKVGHHGSKTSSSEEFVEAVDPTYAVFCVGANNTFGHPRPEVVELMEKVGAKIYRTDKNGAIVFTTDGTNINIETR
ncbi:MAG: DNA internalization-related competence protein ComEC/Rec2 [Selenomonadaceae bacterium]|nr:DNA internalization-related competence protein ComEC/Rec2 [Selenomonadaceae bacterium]